MDCSGFNVTDPDADFTGPILAAKVSVMTLLLLASVFGNFSLVYRIYRRRRKWIAFDWLLRTLGLFGMANGVLNIGVHLTSMISGKWLFDNVGCQIYGIISSVLMSGWIWMLAIAFIERYKSLMSSSDHVSLFSEVNTRIISWGMILLLSVLYLGPIYGWGEYSYLKGKLDVTIDIANYTLPTAPPLYSSSPDLQLINIRGALYSHLQGNGSVESAMSTDIKEAFRKNEDIVLRLQSFSSHGVVLSLRMSNIRTVDCLWARYLSDDLHRALTGIIVNNETMAALQVRHLEISVSIDRRDYLQYRNVYYVYQRSMTCGVDYSPVNQNIYTFTVFSWFSTICLPLIVTVYFLMRIFRWDRRGAAYRAYRYANAFSDDILLAKVIAYTVFIGVFCAILQSASQLVAGLGLYVSGYALFFSTALLYLSWAMLPVCYWFTVHCGLCAKSDCCYYWCCICCCSCRLHDADKDWPIAGADVRKRPEVRGRTDPDIRTRLLTVNRTYSDGSGVISDRNSIRLSSNNEEETCL